MIAFLNRWLMCWSKRIIVAVTCFLQNPLRAVAAAGLGFGVLFVILTGILAATMFIPTAPLAAIVAPLLHDIILGVLALIGIIALTFLGYRNVKASFAGASVEVSAEEVATASQTAAGAIEKLSDTVAPDRP